MMISDENEKNSTRKYMRIYNELRSMIVSGVYKHGEALPSKRSLAADKGVSVITVEHAYELLCDEGYAASAERSRYYVLYTAEDIMMQEARTVAVQTQESVEGVSEDTMPISAYTRAARFVLNNYSERLLQKTPGSGCMELKCEIVSYLARCRGISAQPAQVVIGAGSEYLYSVISLVLGREKSYALEYPSYCKIEEVYSSLKISCDRLRMGVDGIQSSELRRTSANILHITPYSSYPSGVTASASKKQEYLRWLSSGERFIIEDDVESELSLSSKTFDTLFSLDKTGSVIYMNTFSKSISPGLRMAYMILPERLTESYEKSAGFMSCPVPAFEQYVAAQLMNSGDFERHINRVRRKRRRAAGSVNTTSQ